MNCMAGDATDTLGLSGDLIASSFAKVGINTSPDDLAASLLFMSAWIIGQLATIEAQKHGLSEVYYVGGFVDGHESAMKRLGWATEFAGGGRIRAIFVKHASYLGVIGASAAIKA